MDGELTVVTNTDPVRIDLGSGQRPADGWTGWDLWAPETASVRRVDLMEFPWPAETASVDELRCSHYIEHIPMGCTSDGRDLLLAFFDEAYRVLKPGGKMTVVWPALQSVRAFQDPTHRRFIPAETMLYLDAAWRKANALDHYRVTCDFGLEALNPTVDQAFTLRAPEAQAWMLRGMWNVAVDHIAVLVRR
jgi:SAM-dependent methyltransferase